MSLDYFDPRVATGVINRRPVKHSTFTDMFTKKAPSEKDIFEIHVVSEGVSMLPALSERAPGSMRQGNAREASYLKAPRFRPKRGFIKPDIFKFPAGSNPYAPMVDPVEAALVEDMDMHRAELDYTLEAMCAQAIVTGRMDFHDIVDGKIVNVSSVDFHRPKSHNMVLSGDSLWTSANSDLFDMTDRWDTMIQEETNLSSSDLYLGSKAWAAFREHHNVKENLDNRAIDVGSLTLRVGKKFKGIWNGLNIYVLSGTYADIEGTVKHFLDPKFALLMAAGSQSVIEYGMPMDLDCRAPVEVFAKIFKQEDPSGYFSLAESRPLPWTKQPGFAVLAQVIA